MRKIITICLLIITIFTGGMSLDAKTSKKKSKARTTNRVKTETYTELEKQFILPSELVTKRNVKQNTDILKYLKNKGFKITYDPLGEKWESAYKEVLDSETGKMYSMELFWNCGAHSCSIHINFANKQDARNFYKKTKRYNNHNMNWMTDENYVECIF